MELEKQRYGGWRKKCLMNGESGQRESDGISIFFATRNTAVRGAEVHILPLNFPLKKSSIWTAGTWLFYNDNFNLGFSIRCETFQLAMPERLESGGWWRLRSNQRKAFNIISNYRHYGAGLHGT